ncbi:uncharacterized protein DS421_19g651180 [Arachis hypogaea]|uniref:Uncharacterized protein n=1 Tax=Arachis hypogaea TaxID=3818 RepID=A0A6B9V9A9_ARAHY|nr:uncharacterized protein DS421_19g651180 [Arachis hypogaea]
MRRDASEGEKVRGRERERALASGVGAAFRHRAVRSHHRASSLAIVVLGEREQGLRGSSIALLPLSRRQVLPPIRILAIAVEDATAATVVNWDQNCCCVPRAIMEMADSDHYGGVEAIRKLLELLLMSLILLLQFWVVFTFDTYSIWILYSTVTTITVMDLLPLLP